MTLFRYIHTLRHLKPVQFYGRLQHRFHKVTLDHSPVPGRRKPIPNQWLIPPGGKAAMIDSSTFCFLNQIQTLETDADWNNSQWEKLWLYNLNYFDDLNAEDAELRKEWHTDLIHRWINENQALAGNGWEPYPLSLRIVNWVKFFQKIEPQIEPQQEWLNSLAMQVRVLMQRLEHHLLGNHLFANAKALIFAGLYFEGKEAEQWLITGLDILAHEVPEQVLADGGNFELTPMYHSIMLMDMLDLINLMSSFNHSVTDTSPVKEWRQIAISMCEWLKVMCHPDGEISFFNDAAIGIAPAPKALWSYAEALGLVKSTLVKNTRDSRSDEGVTLKSALKLNHLQRSGYIRLESNQVVALLDVAKVGPDYIPGHAHADTLSFELSLFGQRLFVNSGTSCYGLGDERLRQRGTAAHNTVVINEQNSSEVWSGFRVARRAYPEEPECVFESNCFQVKGSHNGYRWLKGKPVHMREWILTPHSFVIKDRIEGQFDKAEARFYLHPDVRCEKHDDDLLLILPENQKVVVRHKGSLRRIEQSTWHPEFGISLPSICLVFQLERNEMELMLNF